MKPIIAFKDAVIRAVEAYNFFRIGEKSASLAYYTLFALIPLFVFVSTLANISFWGALAEGGLQSFFLHYFGPESVAFLERVTENAYDPAARTWATFAGLAIVLYGSVNFFRSIQSSLFELFSVVLEDKNAVLHHVRIYLYSLAYFAIFFIFFTVFFASQFFLTIGIEFFERLFPYAFLPTVIHFLPTLLTFIFLTLFLGISYRLFSRRTISWTDSFIGSVVASVLILILNNLLGYYFTLSRTVFLFDAAGFVVAFLFWVYFFFTFLFVGALIARFASRM